MNRSIRALVVLIWGLGVGVSWVSAQSTTPFSFIAWGDSRGASKGVNTPVLSGLSNLAIAFDPKFTLFAGDLCTRFDRKCTSSDLIGCMYAINGDGSNNGMFDRTFVTRGNHDVGNKKTSAAWQAYFDFAGVATDIAAINFTAMTENETYSFDYGNSHFVSVDVPDDVNVITPSEISWLDTDLTTAEGRGVIHTFIFWHGPFYCVDGHCSYTTTLGSDAPAALVTVFNNHSSIAATFHGHEHVNAHTHLDSTRITGLTHQFEQFVTGEAGAPPYDCSKTSRFDYCTTTPGFVTVEVNGDAVTVSQYLQDGSTPQTWTFGK